MKTNTSNEIFRLSAILYADNNYEVSSSTTLRKIVESAIFENGNEFISIPDLCIFIAKIYDIIISEEEVISIISHQRYTSNFTQKEEQGEQYIKLSNKRLQLIEEKITEKTIDEHIQDFEQLFNIKALEIIHRFLYELFSNEKTFKSIYSNWRKRTKKNAYSKNTKPAFLNFFQQFCNS